MMDKQLWNYLYSPTTIRERANQLLNLGIESKLKYFEVDLSRLDWVINYVIDVIGHNYPTGEIPLHGRMEHFRFDGIDRIKELEQDVAKEDLGEALIGLVIVSVLIDAGAGNQWQFSDPLTNSKVGRSEGLALASLDLIKSGAISSLNHKWHVDTKGLKSLSKQNFEKSFQINSQNPLPGIESRIGLLHRLGKLGGPSMIKCPSPGSDISLEHIFELVCQHFSSLWPTRHTLPIAGLGDTGVHSQVKGDGQTTKLVPFHKLSQWLSYSLVEPFEKGGVRVTQLDSLTGLAEYRNGGLLVDSGVLNPRSSNSFDRGWDVDSEFVVEWRGLTIALLDKLAQGIKEKMGDFSMGQVLQGGTWAAGRKIAFEKRPDGSSPIQIKADANLF